MKTRKSARLLKFNLLAGIPLVVAAGLLAALAVSTGCSPWDEPLADIPENLALGVVSVSLSGKNIPARVTPEQAKRTIERASEFWSKTCGVKLISKAHFEKSADSLSIPLEADDDFKIAKVQLKLSSSKFDDNYVVVVFVDKLQHTLAADDDFVGGIGQYPTKVGPRAPILMAAADGLILAHEFGHYTSLKHVDSKEWKDTPANNPWNLMFPADYEDSIDRTLIEAQCEQVKKHILGHDNFRTICRPESDDAELGKSNCSTPREPK